MHFNQPFVKQHQLAEASAVSTVTLEIGEGEAAYLSPCNLGRV
ncbi:hypothetical protein GPUN_2344 [Glaciecola punicea ACAM 611]|uniref:Uncharacterized protein n=1 Tax=Glaciecola punicea ACAM 611 TaxID=1121923 RepID=H5TDT2_9ALTE|nr:hypothetical protein GPUN_2344 [Glaciecola punicea ACAM 611]